MFETCRIRLIVGLAAGCAVIFIYTQPYTSASMEDKHSPPTIGSIMKAVAVIYPTAGNKATGVVVFTSVGEGRIKVVADIEGLSPNGKHGFHIHQFGDCRAPNGKSAGGHYDPEHTSHHGRPSDDVRHTGDMGNLLANATGEAHYERSLEDVTIAGDLNPILGRGVIVHAKEDDFGQPTGNAGSRIGCGVIGVASTE